MIETINKESKSYENVYKDDHEYVKENEVKRYNNMMKKQKCSNYIKYIFLLVFGAFFIVSSLGLHQLDLIPGNEVDLFIGNKVLLIVIALLLNIIISKLIHYWAYIKVATFYCTEKTKDKKDKIDKTKNKKDKFKILLPLINVVNTMINLIFSPDYYFATFYKQKLIKYRIHCEKTSCYRDTIYNACAAEWDSIRNSRKFFVEFSNWYNVNFSILFSFLIIILWRCNGSIVKLLYFFLIIRLISRAFEICKAYYQDIVTVNIIRFKKNKDETLKNQMFFNGWKRSSIRRSGRISLAVHTLFEMVLLFTLAYYFQYLFNINKWDLFRNTIGSFDTSENSTHELLYFNFFLHSLSVSSFNISFAVFPTKGWLFFHASQVFISMVLIIFSLATYLGSRDDVSEREEDFFKRTLSKTK